jgi:hypothetical protein
MSAGAFDTPGLEMTVVFGVAVPLAIRALCYGAFRFGRLEVYTALLEVFHLEDVLVVG